MRYIPPRIDAEEGTRFIRHAMFFQYDGCLESKKTDRGLRQMAYPRPVPIKLGFETA